jgi:hypothetical protein
VKMKNRLVCCLGICILIALVAVTMRPAAVRAGVDDVLLGARSGNSDPVDPGSVNSTNFTDYFTNNGASPSLTIGGGNGEAMLGAIWTGGADGDWAEIRILIDSNDNGTFDPLLCTDRVKG